MSCRPRFFWVPQHTVRGSVQSAYRVQVNLTSVGTKPTAVVWDSGVVASNASTHIVYAGATLTSDTTYQWSVQWWDGTNTASPWSSIATFSTGLMNQAEWDASDWITCPIADGVNRNQLRAEFSLNLAAGVTVIQVR